MEGSSASPVPTQTNGIVAFETRNPPGRAGWDLLEWIAILVDIDLPVREPICRKGSCQAGVGVLKIIVGIIKSALYMEGILVWDGVVASDLA